MMHLECQILLVLAVIFVILIVIIHIFLRVMEPYWHFNFINCHQHLIMLCVSCT